jgi:ABC-type transporter Mla subunit MlaD
MVRVLFDERHGLLGGEPVRFHDFEVGRVEKVGIASARVEATLSLDPEVASQLTRDSTFSVESDDVGTYLLAHVFDPEAEKLEAGGTLEGVDSGLELSIRQAGSEVSQVLNSISSSELVEQAKESSGELRKRLSGLAEELEKLGRSEEARKLREQIGDLLASESRK